MKLRKLLKNVDCTFKSGNVKNIEIMSVCSSLAEVNKNSLFVAIKGANFDGHSVIKNAVERGAVCVVCENEPEVDENTEIVFVKNSRRALSCITANFYKNPSKRLKLVGITGTNGKTTTAFMTEHIITRMGYKTGIIGTLGTGGIGPANESHNTTPEPKFLQAIFEKMVESHCRYGVMEVSSQGLHQNRVDGVKFEVGIFTNISVEHLDYHKTMEDYFKSKFMLAEKSKTMLVNLDDEYSKGFLGLDNIKYFSVKEPSDFYADDILLTNKSISYMFHAGSDKKRIYLPVLGMFNVYNSLAALSCGYVLGFQLDEMAEAISTFKGVKGRLEYLKTGRNFDIIIDFAHTPQSLKELIQTVKTLTQGRVIVLFGCGGDRDGSKRQLMGRIATMYADFTVITSDNPRSESPHDIIADILKGVTGSSYISIVDREEAIRYAVEIAKPSDCVILAGKGHEDYQILSDRTIHFDEREIVKKILNEKI